MTTDLNYTSERALSGLRASEALSQTTGERAYWKRRIAFWKNQLNYAVEREANGDNTAEGKD